MVEELKTPGLELPDELPLAYCEKYRYSALRDHQVLDLGALTRERTREAVEATVEKVKELHKNS